MRRGLDDDSDYYDAAQLYTHSQRAHSNFGRDRERIDLDDYGNAGEWLHRQRHFILQQHHRGNARTNVFFQSNLDHNQRDDRRHIHVNGFDLEQHSARWLLDHS